MNTGLNNFKKIIYSQWGEDGIIEEIFKRIGTTNKFCVEFGAGGGIELSNTWNLINNNGWQALLIDSDKASCENWLKLLKNTPNAKILKEFVMISGEHSLENILKRNGVPLNLDLLSIDIDSNDHYIFKNLQSYRPRVVIIEHNPTIPPDDAVTQDPDEILTVGASAKANVDLAHEKGYALVAATQTNCIFVLKEEFAKFDFTEPSLTDVFDPAGLSYVISSYNGSSYIKSSGPNPVYGWLYKANNIVLSKSALRAFTFGASLNKPYSESLSKKYQPVKILRDLPKNTGGIIYFVKSIFRLLAKKNS
jgi:hypothetical protein